MPPTGFPPPRWVSFDCYGTLIDWQSGVRRAFRELAHASEDETGEMFEAWERIQWEKIRGPYTPYEEILWSSFRQTVEEFGYWSPAYAGEAFIESLARWQPFADVNPALRRLSVRHRLAIISNVDRHLLGGTIRQFQVRFDALITAEDARAYKPTPAIFLMALDRMACQPNEVVHVSSSEKYDLKPAHELGMRVIYLNRDGLARPEVSVEAETHSLEEVAALW
ncbi:MAG: haloacid dehalogenase type II [Acidobacteria bacterium]|nr:haloacid dehalogenase type II [Acidobacteriota bacterium]